MQKSATRSTFVFESHKEVREQGLIARSEIFSQFKQVHTTLRCRKETLIKKVKPKNGRHKTLKNYRKPFLISAINISISTNLEVGGFEKRYSYYFLNT